MTSFWGTWASSPNLVLCNRESVKKDRSSNSTQFTPILWWVLARRHFPVWILTRIQNYTGWQIHEAAVTNTMKYTRYMKLARKFSPPIPGFQCLFFSYQHSKHLHFSAPEADTKHTLRSLVAVIHGSSDHHEELVACFLHSPGTITTKQQFGAHHHWLLLQLTVKW